MVNPKKKLVSLLFLVSRAHHCLSNQTLERIGLHRAQPPVLFILGDQDGITQSELADMLEVSTPTMTHLLRRMESAGLITRIHDAQDARISRVYLTEGGKDVLGQANTLGAQLDEVALAGFSADEQARLCAYLERMHTNLTRALSAQLIIE
jgi:MarR family transcriptional regulator, organic hydroperoxide resistance regulator